MNVSRWVKKDYLVEGGKDVVCKLDFGNSSMAHGSEANTKSCNTLLREGCIKDTVMTWIG